MLAVGGRLFLNVGMTRLFQGHMLKSVQMSFNLELKMVF